MYTILINKDKSLTTSVKTTLLRNTTTDEIQFLWDATSLIERLSSDTQTNPQPTAETTYMGLLRYEADGVTKSEELIVDNELYKGKMRFILPNSTAFFNNRGIIQLWLDITISTTTTTIKPVVDPVTGEETEETVTETTSDIITTLPTTLFIEEVPHSCKPCHKDESNTIRITRGDSLTIGVTLTDDEGFNYKPVAGDKGYFRVKKSALAEDVLIEKEIDLDNVTINLVESDTKNLAFGNYRYEVEIITVDNNHYTVIKNALFIIEEELH